MSKGQYEVRIIVNNKRQDSAKTNCKVKLLKFRAETPVCTHQGNATDFKVPFFFYRGLIGSANVSEIARCNLCLLYNIMSKFLQIDN